VSQLVEIIVLKHFVAPRLNDQDFSMLLDKLLLANHQKPLFCLWPREKVFSLLLGDEVLLNNLEVL
jgi:hypothetical protein